MFHSPKFIKTKSGGGGIVELPIIHEDVDQTIQGGSAGEHYHLNEEQHQWVQDGMQYVLEPLCSSEADTMYAADGDVVFVTKAIEI
jgi:hypothetical protein